MSLDTTASRAASADAKRSGRRGADASEASAAAGPGKIGAVDVAASTSAVCLPVRSFIAKDAPREIDTKLRILTAKGTSVRRRSEELVHLFSCDPWRSGKPRHKWPTRTAASSRTEASFFVVGEGIGHD